jgi:hypothetical protein
MMELIWLQEEAGFAGNIAEIGVHHGCSALALIAAARPDETVIAIDLLDRQDLNVDESGEGSLTAFQGHLGYLFPRAMVRTIAKSSLEIRGSEAAHGLAGLRFFSVDGGHTRALTLNDLDIADASLAPHGIAALDDVFNGNWPGVVSGLFAFLAGGRDLAPFAIFPNKVFLCRRAFTEFYRKECLNVFRFALHKTDMELGEHRVDTYLDWWPHLTHRLGDWRIAAAAEADIRAIEDSGLPIKRHLIARAGETGPVSSHLEHVQRLLVHEQRRVEVLHHELNVAKLKFQEAMAQLAALRSSTSWRLTAPLRWFGSAFRR